MGRPMARVVLAERAETGDDSLRTILPADERDRSCPHCETDVRLTMDRVIDCIIDHPALIVRETQYWRCPVCNAVTGQESTDYVEPIEYISGSV